MLPATPVKYWTQSVGALEIFDKIEKKINIVDLQYMDIIDYKSYFQLAVQAICLARMFHCFGEVSP